MTILDLIRLIQRHLKLVIALPIIFGVIAVAWSSFTQTTYTATASFVTSGDISFAQALAKRRAIQTKILEYLVHPIRRQKP